MDSTCIGEDCLAICVGSNPNPFKQQQLFDNFISMDCPTIFANYVNSTLKNNFYRYQYNETNMENAQSYTKILFDNYLSYYKFTDDISSSDYNPFQWELLDFCNDRRIPGICDLALKSTVTNISRNDAINNTILTDFYGCYVPPDPVMAKLTMSNRACQYGYSGCKHCVEGDPDCETNEACDPLCRRNTTVQLANINDGSIHVCPQNVCAIDDVSVKIAESMVEGGINFNVLCAGCDNGTDGCLCVISGVNVNEQMANIGLGTNFNELCGSESVCVEMDESGNVVKSGSCGEYNGNKAEGVLYGVRLNWFIVLGVGLIVGVFVLVMLLK